MVRRKFRLNRRRPASRSLFPPQCAATSQLLTPRLPHFSLFDLRFRSSVEYNHILSNQIVSPEDSVHTLRKSWTCLPLMAFLCFAAAGTLRAEWQGEGSAPASSAASEKLNFEFFKSKVQPIFLAKRPGHARCVSCHATNNTALHLEPLPPGSAKWDEEASRKNFESVQRVVVPGSLKSPLLVHPLAERAGGDFFHSGGKHFNSQDDPEWKTLKAFVFGASGK